MASLVRCCVIIRTRSRRVFLQGWQPTSLFDGSIRRCCSTVFCSWSSLRKTPDRHEIVDAEQWFSFTVSVRDVPRWKRLFPGRWSMEPHPDGALELYCEHSSHESSTLRVLEGAAQGAAASTGLRP